MSAPSFVTRDGCETHSVFGRRNVSVPSLRAGATGPNPPKTREPHPSHLNESPRFAAGKLFAGLSITVEPGLYYPGVGGVRIEDVVIVGKTGVRNLTKFEEELELR